MRMTRHLSVVNLLDGCIFFAQWLSMAGIELTDRSQASTARGKLYNSLSRYSFMTDQNEG